MTTVPALDLEAVRFGYGTVRFAFDLAVAKGERVALMGPSGSGKSTLLSLVAGFEEPEAGRVLIEGRDVTALLPAERPVSMIFQENNLFAHLDVAANVGLGISPALKLSAEARAGIDEALQRTGLGDKAARLPRELSGGERQRVAIARALVRDRPLLLLDEAFAALGPALRREMLDLIDALVRDAGMTLVIVSHDPADALAVTKRLVFLEEGRIVADGATEVMLSDDAPEPVRRYLGLKRPMRG